MATLKHQNKWLNGWNPYKFKEIHFTCNLHGNVTMILDEWDPTVEEDGTIRAFHTSDDKIFVIIGENTLYANEDSSYMFAELIQCELIDGLHLINTKNVQNFASAFKHCGANANFFTINGLEKWDVSNVTNMSSMFCGTGHDAKTWSVGDLSAWNVSSVTSMSYMFNGAGYSAPTWSVGDLSAWNVSNVTDMSWMFYYAGFYATTFSVGDLSAWNVSNVTDMYTMFNGAGFYATTWNIGDLSAWDVSKCKYHDDFKTQNKIIEPNWVS